MSVKSIVIVLFVSFWAIAVDGQATVLSSACSDETSQIRKLPAVLASLPTVTLDTACPVLTDGSSCTVNVFSAETKTTCFEIGGKIYEYDAIDLRCSSGTSSYVVTLQDVPYCVGMSCTLPEASPMLEEYLTPELESEWSTLECEIITQQTSATLVSTSAGVLTMSLPFLTFLFGAFLSVIMLSW